MSVRSVAFALLIALPLTVGRAEAVSTRDLIELSRAGLGDEVLLALIEVHGTIFSLDAAGIRDLKAAGVSERVIVAMLRSGRESTPADAAWAGAAGAPTCDAAPPPQVIVIDRQPPPEPAVVAVPVPVYWPIVVSPPKRAPGEPARQNPTGRFISSRYPQIPDPPPPTADPPGWRVPKTPQP